MKNGYTKLLSIISDGKIHSGEILATHLNVSRAAIWKSVKYLQALGLEIEAIRGKGYLLHNNFEFLSKEDIQDMISPRAKKSCRDIEVAFKIKSTNLSLLNRLNHEVIHGSVMLAEYQSEGRGRRNKKWFSPIGSGICLSVGWRFEVMPISLGLLSLYMGIATARTLNSIGLKNVGLKWPNDIFVMDRKIGGVLLDIRGESMGPLDIVIGVGINYELPKHKPPIVDQLIIDICSVTKERLSRNIIAATLLSNIFQMLQDLEIGENLNLIDEWRQFDCYNERKAKLILPNAEIVGILKGIDERGSLLMSVNGKLSTYGSGEVSLKIQ